MKSLQVTSAYGNYPIHFGEIPPLEFADKVLVVSDSQVGAYYLPVLLPKIKAKEICVCVLEKGEAHKNMASVERILETAFLHRLNRKSVMIALGGGVIGDMVGFAAGIFMRGIDFVQIPTTLLAQVDASIGGKTGVNHAYGKNLIGVFHAPSAVYIDTSFLDTLSTRERYAGVAEIIKMAVIFDRAWLEWLEGACLNQDEDLQKAIRQAVCIKQKVVEQDEREKGIRAALNYGHTFGHAIEKAYGYGHYLHGEAVSMGMIMANELACYAQVMSFELKERVKKLLIKNHLPIECPITQIEQFYDSLFLDKKSENGKIRFILPSDTEGFVIRDDFSKEEIMGILKKWH